MRMASVTLVHHLHLHAETGQNLTGSESTRHSSWENMH